VSNNRLANLETLLHREVPISGHMGGAAERYDAGTLTLSAELEPNINIHGTAFGGSQYALASLCGWGLLRLRLEDLSLDAEIVLGSATIDYRRPVRSRLMARGRCEADDFDAFAARVRGGKRASIAVTVALGSLTDDGEWREAAVFNGIYATA